MTFTIEPMINLGGYELIILDDDWTAITLDGSLSAQFEHTILVTEHGSEIVDIFLDQPLRYINAGPDLVENLVLGNQTIRIPDEKTQHLEGFVRNWNGLFALPEALIRQVHPEASCVFVGHLV